MKGEFICQTSDTKAAIDRTGPKKQQRIFRK